MTERTAAPLDLHAVERAAAPHGFSRNLPRAAYVSREVYDWEMTHLWGNAWVCAGRSSDLARGGDCKAIKTGGDGILLTRGDDAKLRGFYNVCRHRGHELLEAGPCAHMSTIRCPYHGWTYELDGRLKVAPRAGDVLGFKMEDFPLTQARIEEWHGWVWVNASGDGIPLAEYLGELDELVRPSEPERLRVAVEKSYDVSANWKLVHENYHECYHCQNIHPQLCKVSPPDSGKNWDRTGAWIGGRMDLMDFAATMSLDGHSDGVPLRGITGEALRKVDYVGVVPNLFLSLHPDYVLTHRLEPLGPDKVRIECQWLFPPEAFEKKDFSHEYAFKFWDITNYQDWRALEGVQRGVSSQGYRPGPLTMKEDAVHRFVSRIARAYLEGAFSPCPVSTGTGPAPQCTPAPTR